MKKDELTIYLNKTEEKNVFPVFNTIISALLTMGVLYSFLPCIPTENLFGFIPIDFKYVIVIFSLLVSVIGGLLYKVKWKSEKMCFMLLAGAFVCVLIIFGPYSIYTGFLGTANRFIEVWNVKFDDAISFVEVPYSVTDLQKFILTFIFLLVFAFWQGVKKNSVIIIGIINVVLVYIGVAIGGGSYFSATVDFVSFFAILYRNVTGRVTLLATSWAVICCSAFLLICTFVSSDGIAVVTNVKQSVSDAYDYMRYGKDSLPEGDMSKAYEMNSGDDIRLLVGTKYAKTLYLKGFVGEIYEDGKWQDFHKAVFRGKNAGIFEWLQENDLVPEKQYSNYVGLSYHKNDYKELDVDVKNVGAYRKYLYLPYSFKNISIDDFYYDKGKQTVSNDFFGNEQYNFREQSQNLPSELIENENWILAPQNVGQEKYLNVERVYRSFVYQNYLDVPEEYNDVVNDMFFSENEDEHLNIYQATQEIRNVLSEKLSFNSELVKPPEGEDALKWYITKQKEGNSAVYASISVLAYRAKGIPARYAEGYYVDEDKQIENMGLCDITNKDAHAWVEVYFDGIGWMPIDTTPGYYFDVYTLQQMSISTDDLKMTGNNNVGNSVESLYENMKNSERKKEFEQAVKFSLLALAGIVVLVLCLIIILLVILEGYRFIVKRMYRARYKNIDNNERVVLLYDLLVKMFRIMGISLRLGKDSEQASKLISQKIEDIKPVEYIRVYEIVEKAIYGGLEIKQYELRTIEIFFVKVLDSKYFTLKDRLLVRYTCIW